MQICVHIPKQISIWKAHKLNSSINTIISPRPRVCQHVMVLHTSRVETISTRSTGRPNLRGGLHGPIFFYRKCSSYGNVTIIDLVTINLNLIWPHLQNRIFYSLIEKVHTYMTFYVLNCKIIQNSQPIPDW